MLYPAHAAYKKLLLPGGWTSAWLTGPNSLSVGMAVAIHRVQQLGSVRAVIDLGKDLFVQTLTQVYDSSDYTQLLHLKHGHCHANTMRIGSFQASIYQFCFWSLM